MTTTIVLLTLSCLLNFFYFQFLKDILSHVGNCKSILLYSFPDKYLQKRKLTLHVTSVTFLETMELMSRVITQTLLLQVVYE